MMWERRLLRHRSKYRLVIEHREDGILAWELIDSAHKVFASGTSDQYEEAANMAWLSWIQHAEHDAEVEVEQADQERATALGYPSVKAMREDEDRKGELF